MTIFTDMQSDISSLLYHRIRIKFYTGSNSNTAWDDNKFLTKSGSDVWTSGLVLPVKGNQGSSEAILIEQGKIKTSDKKIFFKGDTILTAPSSGAIKIGVGSPVTDEHSMVPAGIEHWPPTGDIVYKKLYCRVLPTGSLSGE